MPFGDTSLEMVVLTHPHLDHFGGLPTVLNRYAVKNILVTAADNYAEQYGRWEQAVNDESAAMIYAQPEQEIKLTDNLKLKVLLPDNDGLISKDLNDESIVILVEFYGKKILLTGDAGIEQLEAIRNVDVDVLKVGHHGSRDSTDELILPKFKPEICVISVGRNNRYRHPHAEAINALKSFNCNTKRTDIDGDVVWRADKNRNWQLITSGL